MMPDEIERRIASKREDGEFMRRLEESRKRNRAILDRLAKSEVWADLREYVTAAFWREIWESSGQSPRKIAWAHVFMAAMLLQQGGKSLAEWAWRKAYPDATDAEVRRASDL